MAGFLIMRPSRCRREMLRRELARAISLVSLGSNQILRFPHLRTEAARRFWRRRLTVNIIERERDKKGECRECVVLVAIYLYMD